MPTSSFHLSLNARDIRGTATFLERLLGVAPSQLHADYARFELNDPPIVLSLAPTDAPIGGLNHLGFRLPTRETLAELQRRLAEADIPFDCQESIACCHSRQTKFWVADPAGNQWEFYVLEDAATCADEPLTIATVSASQPPQTSKVWSHRLGEPIPARLPAADGSLDEVVLEGTINADLPASQLEQLLRENARVLRAGGKLVLRGLTADRPLAAAPRLPGPASVVRQVPTTGDVLSAILSVGFHAPELLTHGETYRFEHAGAELRETRLKAIWPGAVTGDPATVIYRGPFARLVDDSGVVFERGRPTLVDPHLCQRLRESTAAEHFVFEPVREPSRSQALA